MCSKGLGSRLNAHSSVFDGQDGHRAPSRLTSREIDGQIRGAIRRNDATRGGAVIGRQVGVWTRVGFSRS